MRKITFGGAISLDNYLASPDHTVDWILWSDEAGEIMNHSWKNVDTMLMGRKTCEVAQKMGGGPGGLDHIKTYVFSRTLKEAPKGATLVRDDAVDFVRELKRQPGKDIILMGGGELAHPLLEADLIDEIGYSIHPLLLGSGISLYHPMKRRIDLELVECRPFKNGCVYVLYRVKHAENR
jgi:dihydrofolate reductase